jgi:hypothetical protein
LGIDEVGPIRTAREGLDADGAGAGVQVEDPRGVDSKCL